MINIIDKENSFGMSNFFNKDINSNGAVSSGTVLIQE